MKAVKVLVICNFLLLSACSYPQNEIGNQSKEPLSESQKKGDFTNDGKLDTLVEMSSLFEKDTTLSKVVIANGEQLKKALRLNLEYLQKKGSGAASPQRSLYYNYKNLRSIKELLQKNESDTIDVSNLQLQKIWGSDKMGNVQFTSYYIPVIEVRRKKDSIFKYPIYKKPNSSYLTRLSREQIDEKNMLDGKNLELAYAKNYFDVFSMQVQG